MTDTFKDPVCGMRVLPGDTPTTKDPGPGATHAAPADMRRAFRQPAIMLLVMIAVTLAACATGERDDAGPVGASPGPETVQVEGGGTYTRLSPAQLATMLVNAPDLPLINVHVPNEGEIEGTDAFLPYDQVADRVDDLPADRNAPLVVYCRSGRMSTIAAETLVRLGYTSVLELDGGFDAWRSAGYPFLESAPPNT